MLRISRENNTAIVTLFKWDVGRKWITRPAAVVRRLAYVCLLSVCTLISATTRPNFTFSMHFHCGWFLLRRRCGKFCISGFVDDVTFSHNVMCISKPWGRNSFNYCINSIEFSSTTIKTGKYTSWMAQPGRSLQSTIALFSTCRMPCGNSSEAV